MSTKATYPRIAERTLEIALNDTPVVLIHGPRQCGKTTLAQIVGKRRGFDYFTLDDDLTREAAKFDPSGFINGLAKPAILDEVQLVPELFRAIKVAVDRDRSPGRFLLTGSTNVLLLPTLSDSLAGRIGILRLHPFSQSEIEQLDSTFLDTLFANGFKMARVPSGRNIATRVVEGGFPAAIIRSGTRRSAWYRDYIETLVQRDIRDLARIAALDAMPRLLKASATYTARLVNFAGLGSDLHLSRPTIRDYIGLLERVFLVQQLPPWHSNRLSRLVKTSKLHINDTGVACSLLGIDADDLLSDRHLLGQLLETFVLQEMQRLATGLARVVNFHHFRDRDGVEVDIVVERRVNELAGVEVKASTSVNASDFSGLRKLQAAAGRRFVSGVVLYNGDRILPFGDRMHAVPIARLWAK